MASFTDLCKKGNVDGIKAMMSSPEFNINQRSKAGKTGLMHAAKQGEKATVLQLVTTQGIEMNARDPKGNTALHWALMNNEKNIALILVKFGAEIGIKNDEGRTPLSMAQTNGYGSELNKARVVLAPVSPPRSASIKQAPKPYKRGSLAEVVDFYAPALGDVCDNPTYYCDTACGPGCMNNCVECNSSLFNTDCYWDSQSYVGRNCSAGTCENGTQWATEFSMHLYTLIEMGIFGLIEVCKDIPGAVEKCTGKEQDVPPPPSSTSQFTPVPPATVPL